MDITRRYMGNLIRFKKYLRISTRLLNDADQDFDSDVMSHIIAMDWRNKNLTKQFLICDQDIAKALSLSVEDYINILKAYGAFKIRDTDMHIFSNPESCKEAISCLYLIAYRSKGGQ